MPSAPGEREAIPISAVSHFYSSEMEKMDLKFAQAEKAILALLAVMSSRPFLPRPDPLLSTSATCSVRIIRGYIARLLIPVVNI